MGYYVNPPRESKEDFLKRHGVIVPGRTMKWDEVPAGMLPVFLLNNGFFTAAGIAYSPRELEAFTQPDDTRPKMIYLVPIEHLLEVLDDPDFAVMLKRNGLMS